MNTTTQDLMKLFEKDYTTKCKKNKTWFFNPTRAFKIKHSTYKNEEIRTYFYWYCVGYHQRLITNI